VDPHWVGERGDCEQKSPPRCENQKKKKINKSPKGVKHTQPFKWGEGETIYQKGVHKRKKKKAKNTHTQRQSKKKGLPWQNKKNQFNQNGGTKTKCLKKKWEKKGGDRSIKKGDVTENVGGTNP